MTKHFATYNQSLALKEIGFNEPCFKYVYTGDTGNNIDRHEETEPSRAINYNHDSLCISQPLKSQVFEWFREKYNLFMLLQVGAHNDEYQTFYFNVFKFGKNLYQSQFRSQTSVYTYEEAESACIDKLIEIIKDGRKIN
jgi:hypothetical protein